MPVRENITHAVHEKVAHGEVRVVVVTAETLMQYQRIVNLFVSGARQPLVAKKFQEKSHLAAITITARGVSDNVYEKPVRIQMERFLATKMVPRVLAPLYIPDSLFWLPARARMGVDITILRETAAPHGEGLEMW